MKWYPVTEMMIEYSDDSEDEDTVDDPPSEADSEDE